MKELSLNILDTAKNSVKAESKNVCIELEETTDSLRITVKDDGFGMKPDFLEKVTDPFSTTRTTRAVGFGLPFLKLAAEQTGGYLEISSKHIDDYPNDHGTVTSAFFNKTSIDYTPLGDVISSIVTLIQGSPNIHWVFKHTMPSGVVELDTKELTEVLGDVPLDNIEVINWIREYLIENYQLLQS